MNTLAGLALLLATVLGPGYVPQTDAPVLVSAFQQTRPDRVLLGYVTNEEHRRIVIQPGVFRDLRALRHVLAHEEGHLLYGDSEKAAEDYACEVAPDYCGYLLAE